MPRVQDSIGELMEVIRLSLADELKAFATTSVVVDNIAMAGAGSLSNSNAGGGMKDAVVLTLIRLTEDASRRNQERFRHLANGKFTYRNPPKRMDMEVLITANYTRYVDALDVLSRVAAVFQRGSAITEDAIGWPAVVGAGALFDGRHLTASLVPLGFEQLNHVWGMLGGKQRPALLYRFQSADIEYVPDTVVTGPAILTTATDLKLRDHE
ncbi:DUF4255 domain-containing protein [Neolewinella antarctica]|uniref:Pvc16 N-terminal domain-containing protein n=1 Tax=Neolewinella antarctica TaxID=442734 RepID=A0ABX0X638_9BACT|nr:DUF4255 domain-containing protein [Neolewinella antarctica]NJC24675.1 hypothetical protein [Neolewinella antarctica]